MTMLVAEFHNGESIARLVRSALRREIAAVTLTARPRANGLHQLQLRLQGAHCVTLAAEPVGRDDSGRYKLLLAPLDPSDESELRAVVRQHGGTDPSPPPMKRSEPPPQTPVSWPVLLPRKEIGAVMERLSRVSLSVTAVVPVMSSKPIVVVSPATHSVLTVW